MENIAYTHAALSYEAEENIEIIPFLFDVNFFCEISRKNNSSFTAINFLSISLILFFLSSVGQALAVEKYGSKNASVTTIQKCLKQLGYLNSSATGYYGTITKNAVIKFQKDNGLAIDGIVGSNTQKFLQSECSSQQSTTNQTNVLQLGSRNQAVEKLQQDLKQLNYFVGNPSGYFGPITKDAVASFQKDQSLTVDGIAGSRTLSAIQNIFAKGLQDNVGGENFSLSLGSRGAEVASLQKRLQRLNYFKGKITGYFGPYTKDVVTQFQKDKKLTVDGIVGVGTQKAIDKAIQASKPVKTISNSKILPLTIGSCNNGNCPTLRFGNKNRYVKYLQTRLGHWGSFKSSPNGNYDSKTVEAVKRFQRASGLSADGVVGPQTWIKIENLETKKPKPEKSSECNKPVLQRGDKGECVTKLQKRLQKLGYFKDNLTSYFGNSTWEAVKQFQLNNELAPNGIVDSQTWKVLEKDNSNYVVLVPVTSPYTLDEVRRFVPDAFIRDTKLGKFVQAGEFQKSEGAQQYSRYFLRERGFNARVVAKDKL
ncbi:peptidoglycan-binding domain 1 [Calothrix parasitica NIES-267]|uniref:Peptidoglycan-binding domain 1 n=1 Tax=Calothrix parasitica NIES-267 TaxID=1973488 RepID=A0A1Z4LS05_9CYAN|nr:peptidoglycan-binding domain 1 [Calothrix parasitica NIES-267]